MSQSMLTERDLGQVPREKLVSLLERTLNPGFQQENIEGFDSVYHTETHVPTRKGASYRKIHRYFKSISQYKKERERRKQILQMYFVEYRTQRYMAEKLEVSLSTVKRDVKKLRGYINRQHNRAIREFQEAQRQRLEQRARMKGSHYRGPYTILRLDLTETDKYGIPKLTLLPRQTANKPLAYPHKVRVHIKGRYEDKLFEADIGGFNIVQTTRW